MIPLSVVITTRNEEKRIGACLDALSCFDDVWVVDSASRDATVEIAVSHGAHLESFVWNGRYPKKRGWCLECLPLKYDWVFFVDADEGVTPEFIDELKAADFSGNSPFCGYFVRAAYIWKGKILKGGLKNNKLAILNRRFMEFPVVDDLDIAGMGEMEGHYQPIRKKGFDDLRIGQMRSEILHSAEHGWNARHMRYAIWEAGMNARRGWPEDPVGVRRFFKRVFKALPFRGAAAFMHCYVLKRGFIDGFAGFDFAKSRARYYRMISDASKDLAQFS